MDHKGSENLWLRNTALERFTSHHCSDPGSRKKKHHSLLQSLSLSLLIWLSRVADWSLGRQKWNSLLISELHIHISSVPFHSKSNTHTHTTIEWTCKKKVCLLITILLTHIHTHGRTQTPRMHTESFSPKLVNFFFLFWRKNKLRL